MGRRPKAHRVYMKRVDRRSLRFAVICPVGENMTINTQPFGRGFSSEGDFRADFLACLSLASFISLI